MSCDEQHGCWHRDWCRDWRGADLFLNEMRKQYFFRQSPGGFFAWDVDKLIELTAAYPRRQVALSEIRDLNEPWFGKGEAGTWAALVEHVRLIDAADLTFPIILAADGTVMDGMHLAAKAEPRP